MSILRLLSIPALPALGISGFLIGVSELRASEEAGRTLAEILALAGEGLSPRSALSPDVRRAQMDLCLRLPDNPVAQVSPTTAVDALSVVCHSRAGAILADTPTGGAALAVLAVLGGAEDLARSQTAAPFGGWLAGHRFAAAQRLAGSPVYAGVGADAALLISLGRAEDVAPAYLASHALRESLAPALGLMPEADKRRFLKATETAGGRLDGL